MFSDTLDVFLNVDQSRTSAPNGGTTGDANRPDANAANGVSPSGWNGEHDFRSINDPLLHCVSQRPLRGVYAPAGQQGSGADPALAPAFFAVNAYNSPLGFSQCGTGQETIEGGIEAQWRLGRSGRHNHLAIAGMTIGGVDLATLTTRDPAAYIYDLMSKPNQASNYGDWTDRMFVSLARRAARRGQRLQVIGVALLQAETDSGVVGIAAAHEAYLRGWWTDKISKLCDQDRPPLFFFKDPQLCTDGVSNGSNTASSNWVSDAYRRLMFNRDAGFPIRTLTSRYYHQSRFIHDTGVAQRKLGEQIGRYLRLWWDEGKMPLPPMVTGVTVGAGADAGKLIATINLPIATHLVRAPNILGKLTTGGFDSFGVVLESGPAINGNVTLRSASGTGFLQIVVPYSGALADGSRFNITGTNAKYSNFIASDTVAGETLEMTWPVMPFVDPDPVIDFSGNTKVDLTEPLAASSHRFNGANFV